MPNSVSIVALGPESVLARSPCIVVVLPPSQPYKEIILTRLSTIWNEVGRRMNMASQVHKKSLSMHRQRFGPREDTIENKLYCEHIA